MRYLKAGKIFSPNLKVKLSNLKLDKSKILMLAKGLINRQRVPILFLEVYINKNEGNDVLVGGWGFFSS